jgi:DNA-binding transcriptional LysR family regulator
MDKLLALKTFIEVADTAGFSRAARNLGVATSSVTRLIDLLEASLGTALLTRSTRQVVLTDAGTNYYHQVTRLLNEHVEADASVSDTGLEPHGSLRVTMPVAYGRLCVGPHIGAFLNRYPKVELDVLLTDAVTDLVAERIDVAVRIGSMNRDVGLIARELSNHRRHVVASHQYLNDAGTPASCRFGAPPLPSICLPTRPPYMDVSSWGAC